MFHRMGITRQASSAARRPMTRPPRAATSTGSTVPRPLSPVTAPLPPPPQSKNSPPCHRSTSSKARKKGGYSICLTAFTADSGSGSTNLVANMHHSKPNRASPPPLPLPPLNCRGRGKRGRARQGTPMHPAGSSIPLRARSSRELSNAKPHSPTGGQGCSRNTTAANHPTTCHQTANDLPWQRTAGLRAICPSVSPADRDDVQFLRI